MRCSAPCVKLLHLEQSRLRRSALGAGMATPGGATEVTFGLITPGEESPVFRETLRQVDFTGRSFSRLLNGQTTRHIHPGGSSVHSVAAILIRFFAAAS